MATISVSPADGIPGYVVSLDGTDRDILFQTDWDYPSLACTFGASPRSLVQRVTGDQDIISEDEDGQTIRAYWCKHPSTDGTIDCKDCGATVSMFIEAAQAFLDGGPESVEDPGYFDAE